MKAIIFGAGGQDGYYLTDLLSNLGISVIPTSRSVKLSVKGDISNFDFVKDLIAREQPSYIFHLAANSTTRHTALFENHETISTGTINILEAVYNYVPQCKVFLSGSAMQFKNDGSPINEKTPFAATSPYAVARIQSVYAGRYYREAFGLNVFVGYFFNHDSPLRTERHVNQKIAKAVLRIANGKSEKLELGDVEVRKEFNFAGDIVKAIWALVNQNGFYEAVIGSGMAYSIKEFTQYCFSKFNLHWENYVVENNSFVSEYKTLVSDPALIKSAGWTPEVGFYQLADMMLDKY